MKANPNNIWIFTDRHTLRSSKGNIFQDGTLSIGQAMGWGVGGGRSQLVVLHLSSVITADSYFWRISLHRSKKASTRLSGPISQLALGLQWDLK